MAQTKIDWCDETINPFTGCRQGCEFCYAKKMATRFAGKAGSVYQRVKDERGSPFIPAIHLDVLDRERARLSRHSSRPRYPRNFRPRRVFVGSMGDMCFKGLATTFSAAGWTLPMAEWWNTNQLQHTIARFAASVAPHTILLLTKRPDRLDRTVAWPRNVHIGVSATNTEQAHDRLSILLQRIAGDAVPWISIEPLLDPEFDTTTLFLEGLGWVVVGGLTGSRGTDLTAMRPAAERIVDGCRGIGIPIFVKDNLRLALPEVDWPREFPR